MGKAAKKARKAKAQEELDAVKSLYVQALVAGQGMEAQLNELKVLCGAVLLTAGPVTFDQEVVERANKLQGITIDKDEDDNFVVSAVEAEDDGEES